MATLLYDELGVTATATVEEIRKAYKKKALQTHPDRLPPTATQDQKREAEEKFRKVNHAYEVLTDPEKRKEYDIHGVWPPPEEEIPIGRGPGRHAPFGSQNAFFSHPHHDFSSFIFTDPFTLFDSIFGDIRGQTHQGFGSGFARTHDPFDRFAALERELFDDDFMGFGIGPRMGGGFGPFGMGGLGFGGGSLFAPMNMGMLPGPSTSRSTGRGGRFVSESIMTQSINGVTTSVRKQRDIEGNEHVTKTFPDGRTVYTLNGVEQPSQGALPKANERKQISSTPKESQNLSPSSSISAPVPSPSNAKVSSSRTSYPSQTKATYPSATYTAPPPQPAHYYNPNMQTYSSGNSPAGQGHAHNNSYAQAPPPPPTTANPVTSSISAFSPERDRPYRSDMLDRNRMGRPGYSNNASTTSMTSNPPTTSRRSHPPQHHHDHHQASHRKSKGSLYSRLWKVLNVRLPAWFDRCVGTRSRSTAS